MLTHWLPLNGNTKNQGLSGNWKSTNITYTNGPLGKSANFSGNCNQKIWFENPTESQILSWAFWVYLEEVAATAQMIISHGRDYICYGFSISVLPNATKATIMYGGKNGNVGKLLNYELLGKWTHIAVTADYDYITTYINGTKMDQYPATLLDFSQSSNAITLGKMSYGYTSDTNYFPLHGKICDVRIYDNCISATEVMEISKGLVCHYPLSNPYELYYRNLYSSTYNCGNSSYVSGYTKTKKSDADGIYYNYTCSHSASATGNSWYSIGFPQYAFTAGKTYTISMKIRVLSCSSNMDLTLRHARVSNDYYGCKTQTVVYSSIEKNIWKEYHITQVIPSSFIYNEKTFTSSPSIEFYTGNLSSRECSMSFDMKDVQVVESDSYLPFIPDHTDGIIHDDSGFANNGSTVESTSPSWNADSIRYRGCYSFSTNQFIAAGKGAKATNSITVSVWAYMNTWNGNGRIVSCTEGGGWNFEANGECVSFPVYVSSVGYISAKSSVKWTSLSSGWHHFVGTYDGLSAKLYLDGKNIASIGTGKSNNLPISYSPNNTIFVGAEAGGNATTPVGNYFNGKISDLRIYATALSDNEIIDLYQRIFSIDQEGGFYCSELIEDNALEKVSLSKTGILSAKDFHEPFDLCAQVRVSTTYTPSTGVNSCMDDAYRVYHDMLKVGDIVTIELDILWDGFDTSNKNGDFNIWFQGGIYSGDTISWGANPYATALNSAKNLKTLVLSKTSGIYHYVVTTTALSASNLTYDKMNIGIRSDYSNGTGKITIQNCHAYNTKDYIGKEKAKFRAEKVLCNKFIEN